jgi:hypothetical protein
MSPGSTVSRLKSRIVAPAGIGRSARGPTALIRSPLMSTTWSASKVPVFASNIRPARTATTLWFSDSCVSADKLATRHSIPITIADDFFAFIVVTPSPLRKCPMSLLLPCAFGPPGAAKSLSRSFPLTIARCRHFAPSPCLARFAPDLDGEYLFQSRFGDSFAVTH